MTRDATMRRDVLLLNHQHYLHTTLFLPSPPLDLRMQAMDVDQESDFDAFFQTSENILDDFDKILDVKVKNVYALPSVSDGVD